MIQINHQEGDVMVKFLHPHGPTKNFHWPEFQDQCLIPAYDLLTTISIPTTTTGRTYHITDKDYNNIIKCFEKKIK